MKITKITYLLGLLLLLVGCNRFEENHKVNKEDYNIELVDLKFDSIYKNFQVIGEFSPNLSSLFLQKDSTIKVQVKEFVDGHKFNPETQPKLLEIRNVRQGEIEKSRLKVLIMVDLTLEPQIVEEQKNVVVDMKNVLPDHSLYVAFLKDQMVTKTMEATDYVINNYFEPSLGGKFFYRSLLSKYEEFLKTKIPEDTIQPKDTFVLVHNLMVVLSDGKVYDVDNNPIDSNHYRLQRALSNAIDSTAHLPILYVNLKHKANDMEETGDSDDLLRFLCKKSGGEYFESHMDNLVIYNILDVFKYQFLTYQFHLQNPDHKVYRGMDNKLEISCLKGDSIIASDVIDYYVGSVYNPVIVNGTSTLQVVLTGLLVGLLLIFVIYLILQFLVPFICYIIFKKKYITHYTGKNMSFNNFVVNEECYFCKAPFVKGDEIVAKCQHVVHKSCWDENEYKCPEHGRNCKQGSHYYNQEKLYDSRNAPYFLSWVLAGACAALVSWIFFISLAHNSEGLFFAKTIPMIFNVDPNSKQALDLIEEYGSQLIYLPFYGLNMGLFLTFALSLLTSHGKWWWKRIVTVVIKALIGGVLGCLAFMIGCIVSIALNFTDNSFLVDWIPWLMSGFLITLVVAFGTEIKLKKALIGSAVSVLLGLGSTYLWSNPYDSQFDTRTMLLVGYMIYCVGFAISIAITYPKSERYFLRVEGPIKEMDIALYKWMNARLLNKYILIGKSVDCELQMTWDITSAISPKQAKISMINGNIYLEALDNGVWVDGEDLKENSKKRLYHGNKFKIGKTTFTYLEKDV